MKLCTSHIASCLGGALAALSLTGSCLIAATPEIRRIPPPGVAPSDAVKAELTSGAASLAKEIALLRDSLAGKPKLLELLPDVEIFHKSVEWALKYDEFFDPKQFDAARKQLAIGMERATTLKDGRAPWNEQTGLVVRAYKSRLDGSIQPYGLIIPDAWKPADKKPMRIDFWLHGRGEKLSELAFVDERMRSRGEFAPDSAIVVHLYERYCNANKFAGELDLFEALEDVKKHYPVDASRLVIRGFSMGGAGCWQYATHHTGMWVAAAPGAGFAETAEFFNVFGQDKTPPPWWEQVLWRWYDCTIYAANLSNTTTVAYSGELDKQKQAADIMSRYMEKEGLKLTHLIGPGVPHKYNPETKPKIEELVSAAAAAGNNPYPERVRFTTYTLIYPRMKWVEVDGLATHWERTDVDAVRSATKIEATTKNVTALRLTAPKEAVDKVKTIVLDGQELPAAWEKNAVRFHREGEKWAPGSLSGALRKRPGLCGPVDHAFMSSFIMVRPTGKAMNDAVAKWSASELEHAVSFWRQVYRGEARVKDDKAITPEDIANENLILWGDPSSNAVLAKIAPKLPISWTEKTVKVGEQTFPATSVAPILIYPNPLNPNKYIVINSGVTYREQALLNNSDQTPKLPDWAVVDLKTPAGPQWPGEVVDAGFFDEAWRVRK